MVEELKIDPANQKVNKLAGITYNNLACYYKKYVLGYLETVNPK